MNTIETGCSVKCIRKSTAAHVPDTTVGEVYTVRKRTIHWINLKETDPLRSNFQFDIKRFEWCEPFCCYPTINTDYFKE